MRTSIFLLLLLPCFLTAQELSLEENVAQAIKDYQQKAQDASYKKDLTEFTKWNDLVYETVLGSTVTPVNLEDRYGELWNLGILVQPFVVHGISSFDSGLSEMKIAAANVVADEYATELMTFLLMPEPENAVDRQRLASISDNIIVVFMEMTQVKDRRPDDTRLLSALNRFPITYYIRSNREIAGIQTGASRPYPKRENGSEMTWEEAHNRNLKKLRKAVRNLLRGKKIKRY